MLDPLSALTVASAVVAFVDFGTKLISSGYKLYASEGGRLEDNARLETVYRDLEGLGLRLVATPRPTVGVLSSDEVAVWDLANDCNLLAERLLSIFRKLQVDGKGIRRSWSSIRSAVRNAMKADEIKTLQKSLDTYRAQINTRLISIIRDDQSAVRTSLRTLVEQSTRARIQHETTLSQLRTDLLQAAEAGKQTLDALVKASTKSEDGRKVVAEEQRRSFEALRVTLDRLNTEGAEMATRLKILDSLYFDEMSIRLHSIPRSYGQTYQWMLQDSSFVSWLERPTETEGSLFWIDGKAGSGKSTLMRFLVHNPETRRKLQAWAGDKQLVMPNFFFWYAGSTMQKSDIGLLQSLLYQILKACPDLISGAAPGRWAADEIFHRHPDPWSQHELSYAMQHISKASSDKVRFAVFIDGLDEYQGDHHELVHSLVTLQKSPAFKLCVSSRPWNVFMDAFGQDTDHKVTLQELTAADIQAYIRGSLMEDARFVAVSNKDERRAHELADEILNKAQGVFLWVFLTVRSLLRGMSEADDLQTLFERIEAFPPDLESFFQRSLERIDPFYQKTTARWLIMARNAPQPLPILSFAYDEKLESDSQFALRKDILPLDLPEFHELRSRATKQIAARCSDLLEVREAQSESFGQPLLQYRVNFAHRTVLDFLETSNFSGRLRSMALSSHRSNDGRDGSLGQNESQGMAAIELAGDFNVERRLCSLLLAQMKDFDIQSGFDDDMRSFFTLASTFVLCARQHELSTGSPLLAELLELDRIGTHYRELTPYLHGHWTSASPVARTGVRKRGLGMSNFLAYCINSGLEQFVEVALSQQPSRILKVQGRPLLGYGLRPVYHQEAAAPDLSLAPQVGMIRLLLAHGADPNASTKESYVGRTVWEEFLYDSEEQRLDHFAEFVTRFLEHGAAVQIRSADGAEMVPAIRLIERVCAAEDLDELRRAYGTACKKAAQASVYYMTGVEYTFT